jgi:hypothetical protein
MRVLLIFALLLCVHGASASCTSAISAFEHEVVEATEAGCFVEYSDDFCETECDNYVGSGLQLANEAMVACEYETMYYTARNYKAQLQEDLGTRSSVCSARAAFDHDDDEDFYGSNSGELCFGGAACDCIGGKIGDACLLTVVGIVVILLIVGCSVWCCCIRNPNVVDLPKTVIAHPAMMQPVVAQTVATRAAAPSQPSADEMAAQLAAMQAQMAAMQAQQQSQV